MNGAHPALAAAAPPIDPGVGLATFDRQPRWMKELLWYSSLNLTLDALAPPAPLQAMIDALRALEAEHAAATWPADHPACAGRERSAK